MHTSEIIFVFEIWLILKKYEHFLLQNSLLFWPLARHIILFKGYVRSKEEVLCQTRNVEHAFTFDLMDLVTISLNLDFFLGRERDQMAEGKTACTFAAAEIEYKRRHVMVWQHRWHVMDTTRLYPGLLSYVKWSVNTTFLLANGICQHESDFIVGLSFVSAEFAAKSRPPPLLWTFSVSSGELCSIMKLPLRKQIRSNSQGEEHWNQIALIMYQVLQCIHKGITVMKDEPKLSC